MRFYKKTLPNGLRIITVPMKDNPTVTVLVMVEAGSKYETKNINGLSHFLEHMVFKGTVRRPTVLDIASELDGLGSSYNAYTGQEFTGYYAKSIEKHFPQLLDIVSDVYLNSTFPKPEIKREKGVIAGEIDMINDEPSRHVHYDFLELLYGDQPAGWTITGTKDNVRGMKQKDFFEYKKKHYVARGTIIIVAGNITESKVLKGVKKHFSTIPESKKYKKKKIKESQAKPNILVRYKKTDQAHLMLGVRGYSAGHKDTPALNVLAGVLGSGMSSRLFQKLREEMGIGYYVYASNEFYTDHGILYAAAGVDNKRVGEAIKTILGEFRKLRLEAVSTKELKKVKDYMIGNMYLKLEPSNAFAEFYGMQEVLGENLVTPQEAAKKIKAVTAGDIKRVARKIFKDDRLNLALIGPLKDKKAFSKILHL